MVDGFWDGVWLGAFVAFTLAAWLFTLLGDATALAKVVRELRERLYFLTEYREPHERDAETIARERQREETNRERRVAWDAETERLINGD